MNELLCVPDFHRLSDYVGAWAIEPNAGRALLKMADATDWPTHMADAALRPKAAMWDDEPRVLDTPSGNKVAVVTIAGTMMKSASSLSRASSTVSLRRQIRSAVRNSEVSAILLAIDSPGGTVAGTSDLAGEVRAANEKKPVWAFIDDLGASAAYWVASQAEKVFANADTALVGSVGTIMVLHDLSGMAAKEGIRTLVVATGPLKGAGAPGSEITPEQEAYFRNLVETSQESFDAAVLAGRGLAEEAYRGQVRTGEVFPARRALELGLIDGIQSIDDTIAALGAAGRRKTGARPGRAAAAFTIGSDSMTFAEWLASKGFDGNTLSEAQWESLESIYDAQVARPTLPVGPPIDVPDPASIVATIREQIAAEHERVAGINSVCAEYGSPKFKIQGEEHDVAAWAIKQGWDVAKAELEALRASRTAPAVIARDRAADVTRDTLTAGLMLALGGFDFNAALPAELGSNPRIPAWMRAGVNSDVRQRTLELGHRYQSMSAMDLARECARMGGHSVASYEHDEVLRAATSGGHLTNIFTDSVNARLLITFLEAPDTTTGWTQPVDVADFKEQTDIRLQKKGGGMSKLPRGGTADHGSRRDQAETYKIFRYAEQFSVDEQDMIDDNLGAITEFPVEMGNAAKRIEPDLVYYILLSNPTLAATSRALFNTTDGNYVSGGAALASATLKAGIAAMGLFQENNVNLNVKPRYLLTGWSLSHLAYELANSSEILIAGTAGTVTERGTINSLRRDGLVPVTDARLENGVTDPDTGNTASGSATKWILVGENVPTILKAYRRGTGRMPRVRSYVHDKGKWGIGWDINHDVGAKAREWRGVYQANG